MASNAMKVFYSRTLDLSLQRAHTLVAAHPDMPGLNGLLSLAERRVASVDSPETLFETARWLSDWLDSLELTFANTRRLVR